MAEGTTSSLSHFDIPTTSCASETRVSLPFCAEARMPSNSEEAGQLNCQWCAAMMFLTPLKNSERARGPALVDSFWKRAFTASRNSLKTNTICHSVDTALKVAAQACLAVSVLQRHVTTRHWGSLNSLALTGFAIERAEASRRYLCTSL